MNDKQALHAEAFGSTAGLGGVQKPESQWCISMFIDEPLIMVSAHLASEDAVNALIQALEVNKQLLRESK